MRRCLNPAAPPPLPALLVEETLLREIENRYPAPDAVSPRHISASPASSSGAAGGVSGGSGGGSGARAAAAPAERRRPPAGGTAAGAGSSDGARVRNDTAPAGSSDTVDFQPALAAAQSLTPVDSMESAEK